MEKYKIWKFTAIITAVVFFGSSVFTFIYVKDFSKNILLQKALEDSKAKAKLLESFRSLYTAEVVTKAQKFGMKISHDYKNRADTLPLPATLTKIIGKDETATYGNSYLYSPFPFPWRDRDEFLNDPFKKDAWDFLIGNPDKNFHRIEYVNGLRTFRFAKADVMRASCVHCHNTHTDTPKKDWKVGDVRGVLEVQVPIEKSVTASTQKTDTINILVLMTIITGIMAFLGLAFLIKLSRQEKNQALQQGGRINTILNSAIDAIVSIDSKGSIQKVNPAAESLFGYGESELLSKNVKILMPNPYRDEHDEYLENFQNTGVAKIIGKRRELEALKKNGDIFPIELSVGETKVDGESTFVGTLRDITERKKNEHMKDEFIATVSHELKTPLAAIRGSLGLVAGGATQKDISDQTKKLLDVAVSNCERLARLVNNILDLEKISSGVVDLRNENLNCRELIDEVISLNESYSKDYNVKMEKEDIDSHLYVQGDHDKLIQALTNLISNAIKFTSSNGKITVGCKRNGDCIQFSVRDYGEGISEEFRPRIFTRFSQEDSSSTRSTGGSGLGLSITKSIIELHGGSVSFETEMGRGSTFFFDLKAS